MRPAYTTLEDARRSLEVILRCVLDKQPPPLTMIADMLVGLLARISEHVDGLFPFTEHSMERDLPVMLHWNCSKGYSGDPDTPDDPPHLEDVAVMLGEHEITDLLSPEQLADVREAMLRDMEAGT